MGNATELKYSTADFNQLSILLALAPASAGQLELKVKSSITDSVPAVYSNTPAISVTPYLVVINYPLLWVPGEYQGWDPAAVPKISSKLSNVIYEGYVNFPGPALVFKYTSHPDWSSTNYG